MSAQSFWLDYSQRRKWQELVALLPRDKQDIYYTPEYLELYANARAAANCYAYIEKDNIYIYPFMKGSVPWLKEYFDICTPYGYGGPLSNTEDHVFLNSAYQCFCAEARERNIVAELIKFHPLFCNYLPLEKVFRGNIMRMRSTVYAEIDIDEELRWKDVYSHANRKNINKAKRNNLEIRIGKDSQLWDDLRSLYEKTMCYNKAGDFYFFSPDYFKRIASKLDGSYILAGCLYKGMAISVLLVLLGKAYAHCHLIGTARESMNLGGNNLLHHELILWCKKNGYKKLHLGGGRTDGDDDLLLRFKKNFSDKICDFYVGESILNQAIYDELCASWSIANPGKCPSNRLLKYRL
jgi:hypothetical protein